MWRNGLFPNEKIEEVVVSKGFLAVEGNISLGYCEPKRDEGNPFSRRLGALSALAIQKIHKGHPMLVSSSDPSSINIRPFRFEDMYDSEKNARKMPADIYGDSILNDTILLVKIPYHVKTRENNEDLDIKIFCTEHSFSRELPINEGFASSVIYFQRDIEASFNGVFQWSSISAGQVLMKTYSWLSKINKVESVVEDRSFNYYLEGYLSISYEDSRKIVNHHLTPLLEKRFDCRLAHKK